MTIEQRVATALERIEDVLTELVARAPPATPPVQPRVEETPVPAHELYLSGQWKRRDGHNIQASVNPQQHVVGSPPIGTQLDPWVKRDVPMIDGEDDRAEPPITVNP